MDIVGKKLLGLQMMGFFIDRIIVPLKRREIELDLEEKERKREKKPFLNDVYNYNKCYLGFFFV